LYTGGSKKSCLTAGAGGRILLSEIQESLIGKGAIKSQSADLGDRGRVDPERTIQFILEQQAQLSAQLQAIAEQQASVFGVPNSNCQRLHSNKRSVA
jgi:hypothetical protein